MSLMGLSGAYENWKNTIVAQDTSDWNICAACMSKLGPYLEEVPSPTGIKRTTVSADPAISAMAGVAAEQKYKQAQRTDAKPKPTAPAEKAQPHTRKWLRLGIFLAVALIILPCVGTLFFEFLVQKGVDSFPLAIVSICVLFPLLVSVVVIVVILELRPIIAVTHQKQVREELESTPSTLPKMAVGTPSRKSFHVGDLDLSLELPEFVNPYPRLEEGALVFATDEKNGEMEILLHSSMLSSPEVAVSTWYLGESSQFRVQIPPEDFQSFQTKLGTAHFIVVRLPGEGEGRRAVYHVFIPHCVGSTGIKVGYMGDYDKFEESRRVEINNAIQSLEVAEG